MEQLAEAGTEFAVEGGATDLEQEIGAAAGPSHLLGFVHAAIDQEVSAGDCRVIGGAAAIAVPELDRHQLQICI